jgi:hypothetical protein
MFRFLLLTSLVSPSDSLVQFSGCEESTRIDVVTITELIEHVQSLQHVHHEHLYARQEGAVT